MSEVSPENKCESQDGEKPFLVLTAHTTPELDQKHFFCICRSFWIKYTAGYLCLCFIMQIVLDLYYGIVPFSSSIIIFDPLTLAVILFFIGLRTVFDLIVRPRKHMKRMKETYGDTWGNSYLFYEERFIMRTTGPKSTNDVCYYYTDLSKISLMKHSIFFRTAARQRVWINRFCLSVEEERQIMDIFKARCLNVKDRIFVLK